MNNKKTELSLDNKEKYLSEHFFFRRECGIEDMGCNMRRCRRERTMLIFLGA